MAGDVRLHPAPGVDGPAEIPADPQLVADGWVRRHLVDAARAPESVDLYTSLGFEVTVRPVTGEDVGPRCGACAPLGGGSCVLIYTRRKEQGGGRDPLSQG